MGKGGQPELAPTPPVGETVSATRFAELTGVSRERLRTWERRHGFPDPVRRGAGRRRYLLDDVSRVVAVRDAVDQGVPVAEAIAAAGDGARPWSSLADLGGESDLVASLPLPLLVLSGPQPLTVTFVNRALDSDLAPGADLLDVVPNFKDSDAHAAVLELFAANAPGPRRCEGPPLDGSTGASIRSLAFKLAAPVGNGPLVALVALEDPDQRAGRHELLQTREQLDLMQGKLDAGASLLESIAAIARGWRAEPGAGAAVRAATDQIVAQLAAADAAVAVYMTGELVLGSSSRGEAGPAMVPLGGFPDLQRLLHSERGDWLPEGSQQAFGINSGAATLGVPIVVAGDVVGLLCVIFEARRALEPEQRRFLDAAATMIGFALLRDRFLIQAREVDK